MNNFPDHQAAVLKGHNGPVHTLAFSSGTGSYLLTGGADRTIRLFNTSKAISSPSSPSSALVQTFSAHGYEVLDLAVTPDNSRFASVGGDRLVFLWDVATGTTVRRWSGHTARINAVAFAGSPTNTNPSSADPSSSSSSVIISGSFDATVKLWDVRAAGSARPIQTLGEARDSVTSVTSVGDDTGAAAEIIAASADGRVRTYDLRMGVLRTDCVGAAAVTSVAVGADGNTMLVASLDSTLRLFDRADGRCLRAFVGHKNDSYRIRACFDGRGDARVLCGGDDGGIYVWDVVDGEIVRRLGAPGSDGDGSIGAVHAGKVVSAVAWNGRKSEWASAGSDGTVVVWNASGS